MTLSHLQLQEEVLCSSSWKSSEAYWVLVSNQAPGIQELSPACWFTQVYSNSSTNSSARKTSKWILCCFKALLSLSWGQWTEQHTIPKYWL